MLVGSRWLTRSKLIKRLDSFRSNYVWPSGSLSRLHTVAKKSVTIETINPNFRNVEYAMRGPIATRASQLEKELEEGIVKPFNKVIRANFGDAHAMGQSPITYIRQVLVCMTYPKLMEFDHFPKDVIARAKEILKTVGGQSIGAYTAADGIELIRRRAAEYITQRDGHHADWQNICLSAGATDSIKKTLQLFCSDFHGKPSGVMIPIPQYPLYSATLAEYGLAQVNYYLDEDTNWGLDPEELERAYIEGNEHSKVRALVIINPGNPTGQVLTRANIEDIIKFAYKHSLFILADEVYQHNVYAEGSKFYSFKKVMTEMGEPYNQVELASFMSVSKGYMGECGLRGGWMELVNMDKEVQADLFRCVSASFRPNTLGQATVDCIARPPQPGEPSYELWHQEKTAVLESLHKRARMIADTFNTMEGFRCNEVQGAMYAFPSIQLPPKAIAAAQEQGVAPDVFYAFRLLEDTGICIVPGTGFGQKPGSYHFRTTILPQPDLLRDMLEIFQTFHAKFTEEYK